MPTFDPRTGEPAEEVSVRIPAGLDVRRIVIRHSEVSFRDAEDREAVLVQRGVGYPGAGLACDIADHVQTEEPQKP